MTATTSKTRTLARLAAALCVAALALLTANPVAGWVAGGMLGRATDAE